MISKFRSTSTGARPIDGSSISISFGRDISARAIATICCSPPESVPASCARRSYSSGKSVVDALEVLLRRPAAQVRAHLQVLEHRHRREQPAVLRDDRDPAADPVRVGRRVTSSPPSSTLPGPRPDDPEDRLQRRRLPGRVAAEEAHELALAHLDVHVLEDVDQPVVGVDPLESEQRARRSRSFPRRRSERRGRPRPPSGRSRPLERALGDLHAVVERDHAVGDALDDVHVVLDQEDRVAALARGARRSAR